MVLLGLVFVTLLKDGLEKFHICNPAGSESGSCVQLFLLTCLESYPDQMASQHSLQTKMVTHL